MGRDFAAAALAEAALAEAPLDEAALAGAAMAEAALAKAAALVGERNSRFGAMAAADTAQSLEPTLTPLRV